MRRRLIAGVIVLLAAVVALAFWLAPRSEQVAPVITQPSPEERTPPFAFAVGRTGALPTAFVPRKEPVRSDPILHLHGASKIASTRAITSITRLYRAAFLDPGNWRPGTYDTLWRDFARAAKARARKDVRILTAGGTAGGAYVAIVPRRSTIGTTVLLDRRGKPVMVLADARFRALGRTIAGSTNTMFQSSGRFFLERVGGSWRIVSYDVRRTDEKVAA